MNKIRWTKIEPISLEDDDIDDEDVKKMLNTHMGIILNPIKDANFWQCDTNFNITKRIALILNSIPGVEVLRVMTRYQFIIIIGKLFDEQKVQLAIEEEIKSVSFDKNQVLTDLFDKKYLELALKKKKELDEENLLHWAFYIFPHGKTVIIKAKDNSNEDAFLKKFSILVQAQELSQGILVHSDE